MKQDFLDYIAETFEFSPAEMQEFSESLSKPLKKTIRVNTNKISIKDFKELATKNNWKLSETPLGKNMFYIDREDTSIALGHTLEHIIGYFYIQELSASSSVFYLSGDTVDTGEYTILDMSASPGGKTTQLAEYYPSSLIIANEKDKSRMPQLQENIDRMCASNTYITNYDGRYFKHFPETFDKILLDAPCSGEGTAYKNDDALKYWNIKNVKRIAKLQYQLLENAFTSLKVGGELVYSTCTLNRLENEEIINKLTDNYGEYFEIIPAPNPLLSKEGETSEVSGGGIRSWPHRDNTGGFFVVKLTKKESILPFDKGELEKSFGKRNSKKFQKNPQGFEKLSNTTDARVREALLETFGYTLQGKLFTYRDEIYHSDIFDSDFWEDFFFYKTGIKIGKIESGAFVPNFYIGTSFGVFSRGSIDISSDTLHELYQGKEIPTQKDDGYYQILCDGLPAGIIKVKNHMMKSLLETGKTRK